MSSKPQKAQIRPADVVNAQARLQSRRLNHANYVLGMTLLAGLPGVAFALGFLWRGDYTPKVQWTLSLLIVGFWLGCAFTLRERVTFPLQTLSNLLAALREGDFSIRARGATHDDPLGEALLEVNSLGQIMREQRLGAMAARQLLETVMAEIEVAVFAFDQEQRLRLVNRAGERLLSQPMERLLLRSATELGLADCLEGDAVRTIQRTFPSNAGRWEVRRSVFHERGLPHHLLVITNLNRALREEERQAWQRLVRVLGHELNNSLTPIKSIAGSLERILAMEPLPEDWREDAQRGLSVIASRVASLTRFMEAYAKLARLPQPQLETVDLAALLRRIVNLETRLKIELLAGEEMTIRADGDQLEQLLINIIRNAVDASAETLGGVQVRWQRNNGFVEVVVEDEGHGIANPGNLFVPFFTTKPSGTGIGLVLSRQIAEAHGGTLTLDNRRAGHGCEARLRLPLHY